jgi:DNA-binding transcriptional MerR regulator
MRNMVDDSQKKVVDVTYRSGAAARLAGVPVETLRVWERRYAVSDPQRSEHGQRHYSLEQVQRLNLIKQLVDLGNPIGNVAQLSTVQLSDMLEATHELLRPASAGITSDVLRIALIGDALVRHMAGRKLSFNRIEVVKSCANLAVALDVLTGFPVDVLVIELSEMTQDSLELIAEVRQMARAGAVLMLYRFCSSRTIRQLRQAGYLVARMSHDVVEIESLCHTALVSSARYAADAGFGQANATGAREMAVTLQESIPARLFDDAALEAIAASAVSIDCECPRHLVEILLTLVSFERYSEQCENSNSGDAALHRDLQRTTAKARSMLESALQRVAIAEGLSLP